MSTTNTEQKTIDRLHLNIDRLEHELADNKSYTTTLEIVSAGYATIIFFYWWFS